MTEEEMRELAGYSPRSEAVFLGETWELYPDALAALIRYARSATPEGAQAAMAATYQLLSETIIDFTGFQVAAAAGKAQESDIGALVHSIVEHYCARNYWPAMRLIGLIAAGIEEIDGQLLKAGGRGLAGFSAREACNLALTIYLEGRDEEDRDFALEDLNYEGNPEGEALKLLRQMQAEQAANRGEHQP